MHKPHSAVLRCPRCPVWSGAASWPPTACSCCPARTTRCLPACLPACRIEKACLGTIAEGKYLTRDLGGKSGTTNFTKAIIGRLDD